MSNPNNNMNAYRQALEINRKLKRENDEIYEHVFGDDASNRYTHQELIAMLDEMYDCYKYVVDNNNQNAYRQALQINRDLKRENDRLKEKIKLLMEIIEEKVNEQETTDK